MAERYAARIRRYCEARGISIPIGFNRRAANRYAIIELSSPPKLVARTWFNQEDVVYYLSMVGDGVPRQILDFKDGDELILNGKELRRTRNFDVNPGDTNAT
jgi:hypothetical protein